MITLQTQFQPTATVLATTLSNEETVLLDLQSNFYYSLNETGTHIWQGLGQGLPLGEISRALVAHYTVTLAEADVAVLALLRELSAENLVQPLPVPTSGRTHG